MSVQNPQRIIAMCREHLGDIVNTTGALFELRQQFSSAYIVAEVGERTVGVLENFPVDEVWERPTHQGFFGKLAFVRRLRRARFDLCVIFDDSNVMVLLARAAGIPHRVGVFRSKHRSSFTASVPFSKEGHDLFDSLVGVLKLLGAEEPDVTPRLFPSDEDFAKARTTGIPQIGLFVGASDERKLWPAENWAALADELARQGKTCAIFFGPGEGCAAKVVQDLAESKPPLMTGFNSVLGLAAALSLLERFVSADTGPAHLAAAMGTPCVVLYGPTDPARFYPFGDQHQLLHHQMGCSLYDGICAAGAICDHRCMRAITPHAVARVLG